MHALRLRALMAAAFISIPLAGQAQEPSTLATLFEQAWQRSPLGRSQEARMDEGRALRTQSRTWLADAPTLGIAQRSDRWNDGPGQRETEASLAATVHLPGQVSARRIFAERSQDEIRAHIAKARLELAGELRTKLWDLAAARTVLEERESHLKHTGELADEVARKVKAGELARSDSLLAIQELANARILAAQASTAVRMAQARLELITGSAVRMVPATEPLAEDPGKDDPRLAAAEAEEHRAAAALAMARADRLPAPTVSVTLRREREARLLAPQRSIGFGVQVPLGSAGRNGVESARALAAQEEASAAREQAARAIAAQRGIARARLADARTALQAAEQRAVAMREYSQLIDKAFRLGERGLADQIRAHTQAHEAEIALRQQQVAVGRAHAEHNQAAGVLP
jgi:outer membrane protein TolC